MPGDRPRLRDVWPFGRPKTPGFGIRNDCYLSILASTSVLPSIRAIADPKGAGGAVPAYGAPLEGGDGQTLDSPIMHGRYVIASLDKKTVFELDIVSPDDLQFDPAAVVRELGDSLGKEVAARILATWNILQLKFKSHDPAVYPSLDLLLDLSARIGDLTEGVIGDSWAQTYKLPGEVRAPNPPSPEIDARNFVSVKQSAPGKLSTLGLGRFNLPEVQIDAPSRDLWPVGIGLLLSLAHASLLGTKLKPGSTFGAQASPLISAHGGTNPVQAPVIEFLPKPGQSIDEALLAYQAEHR